MFCKGEEFHSSKILFDIPIYTTEIAEVSIHATLN